MFSYMYLYYSYANNMTPENMLVHDEQNWPHNKSFRFDLWKQENLNAFLTEFPEHNFLGTLKDEVSHHKYDKWLNTKYGVVNEN